MHEPLPIDSRMIDRHISFTKGEYGTELSREQAITELEDLKSKGCLLYDDCRNCPKFGKSCPL